MLILWTILISTSVAHKVYDSAEDIGPEAFINVTTLYPITTNSTEQNATNHDDTRDDNTIDTKTNETDSKEVQKNKIDATIWKIEAAFAESNVDKYENSSNDTDKKNDTKEFKPSQQLGTFYDDFETPTRTTFTSFKPLKKPAGFVSSIHDDSFTKLPKQIQQNHKLFPYKYETPILTRSKDPWKVKSQRPDSLDSKPTAEVPVRVPAGSLYKYQDPFQGKPGDDDFGLEFTDGKDGDDNSIKKRVNPWERFFQLVTAFLPVGLIISALTPSIITIEDTANAGNTYPSNIYRRTDPDILEPPSMSELPSKSSLSNPLAELPRISERCRRRLLCELHSDSHYDMLQNTSPRRGRQCYKIRCDNTEALAATLKWLKQYRQHNGHSNN